MAGYRKPKNDGPSSEDKALDLFAEMLIEKIESIRGDWRKPWFTEGTLQWPRNLSGREYNGMNACSGSTSPARTDRSCPVCRCCAERNRSRSC